MNELAPKESGGEFLLYQTEDGRSRIEVRLQGETVWLTNQSDGQVVPCGQIRHKSPFEEHLRIRRVGVGSNCCKICNSLNRRPPIPILIDERQRGKIIDVGHPHQGSNDSQ
jgi:hypothetical protein